MSNTALEDLDERTWPEVVWVPLGDSPEAFLVQWRVIDALDRMGLASYQTGPSGAVLRLWRRGRKTDEQMGKRRPIHVHAPWWVNELLDASRRGNLDEERPLRAVLDPELVQAAEAVVRLARSEVDAHVAVRKMVEAHWRVTA